MDYARIILFHVNKNLRMSDLPNLLLAAIIISIYKIYLWMHIKCIKYVGLCIPLQDYFVKKYVRIPRWYMQTVFRKNLENVRFIFVIYFIYLVRDLKQMFPFASFRKWKIHNIFCTNDYSTSTLKRKENSFKSTVLQHNLDFQTPYLLKSQFLCNLILA